MCQLDVFFLGFENSSIGCIEAKIKWKRQLLKITFVATFTNLKGFYCYLFLYGTQGREFPICEIFLFIKTIWVIGYSCHFDFFDSGAHSTYPNIHIWVYIYMFLAYIFIYFLMSHFCPENWTISQPISRKTFSTARNVRVSTVYNYVITSLA